VIDIAISIAPSNISSESNHKTTTRGNPLRNPRVRISGDWYKILGAAFGAVFVMNLVGPLFNSPNTTDPNGQQHLGGVVGAVGPFLPLLLLGGLGYGLWKLFNRPDTSLKKSDITTVETVTGGSFDPSSHWKPDAGVFLGRQSDDAQPVYIPNELYLERHMQIIGPTGSGKGVLLGNLAAQAIHAGRGLVVIDPKRDKYMGHILADACRKAGRKLHIVDLQFPFVRQRKSQCTPRGPELRVCKLDADLMHHILPLVHGSAK